MEEVEREFIGLFLLTIIDKHGNTIKTYFAEEGRCWSIYSYYLVFGTMKMFELFKAVLMFGKLSYKSTIIYLGNS